VEYCRDVATATASSGICSSQALAPCTASETMRRVPAGLAVALLLGLWLSPSAVIAQTGVILGSVLERGTSTPLHNARVEARSPTGAVVAGTLTDVEGRFRLARVEPGIYTVVAHLIGYQESRAADVVVRDGEPTTISIFMPVGAFELNPVVVSASRRQEKALDAPAMVSVVNSMQIEQRPAVSPVDHVRNVPGLDIIQQGVQAANVVARGFNNVFSTTLHTLSDYRLASIPSLRVNLLHFIPANNEDIDRIEVVLGPGAALYGPNTSSGVLHIITRSPLAEQGTVASIAGGERSVLQGSFRTAHLLGDNLGLKISGQYLQGDEWQISPTEPGYMDEFTARQIALSVDPTTRIGLRDHRILRYGGDARVDWRVNDRTTAVFAAGHTVAARGLELTGIGAGQTINWSSSFVQARATSGRLFGQAYMNLSDAGDTYIVVSGLPIVDRSRIAVGQVQHGFDLGDRQVFTYGADVIHTMPNTGGTIHGRNEDDDYITEAGAYLQSETRLSDRFDLVLAGRADHHSRLDNSLIFSPRAALVFSPTPEHSFRATFNQAFSTPVSFNLFLDIDAGPAPGALGQVLGYRIRAMGTEPAGFTFTNPDGSLIGMRSPFAGGIGAGRGDMLGVDPTTLWRLGITALHQLGGLDDATANFLRSLSPTAIGINVLNPSTLAMTPLEQTEFTRVPRAQESLNSTFEIGYQGIFGGRFRVSAGLWYENRSNFTSPLTPFTPLLLLDSLGIHATAQAAFQGAGMPEAEANARAAALARGMSGLPLGVVTSPEVSQDPHAYVVASYRNFGEVSLAGVDLSLTALLHDLWSLTMAGSLVNKDHFFFEEEGWLVGLNAPKRKGSAALQYHDLGRGLNGELRVRHTASFPVSSAPYSATQCLDIQTTQALPGFTQPCIPAATLVDANIGYRLPFRSGTSIQLAVTNVFDTGYRSFVGVPEIGRFAMLRIRHEF
jgi:outer membrane receptor for ferrienterochelin and colicins